ncbi:MAG TPA: hypothetical protein PKY05_17745, partial [Fibrobacteria bacterium]|nr:hypothetical protein [Fibrobacteria bacterium]
PSMRWMHRDPNRPSSPAMPHHPTNGVPLGTLQRLLEYRHFLAQTVLLFSIYSFAGWVIEVIYRSSRTRAFVNAGFLRGPFLPIYGLGSLSVLSLAPWLDQWGHIVQFVAFGVVLTVVEYGIGTLCEKSFGVRMWDYSENAMNLHGRVCLPFSVLWAALAWLFSGFVHPHVRDAVDAMDPRLVQATASALTAYFLLDFAVSVNLLYNLVDQLSRIYRRHASFSGAERGRFAKPFQRLLIAFPNLGKYLDAASDLRARIDNRLSALQVRFLSFLESRMPQEDEFRRFVRDIAVHPEFSRTRLFRHHDSSIFRHALRVSMISYRIGKYLHLDARAMARGGLLHDFFLYDWRNHDLPDLAKEKFHGFEHPYIALRNAQRHFTLTALERDIIAKHMWPLTSRPPRHMESILVCAVDKIVATREFWSPVRTRGMPSTPVQEGT